MIRGAFILAVGISIGYVKGLTDADKVVAALGTLGGIIKDVAEVPTQEPDIEGTATEAPAESDTDNDTQDKLNEGESNE